MRVLYVIVYVETFWYIGRGNRVDLITIYLRDNNYTFGWYLGLIV